MSRKKKYYEDIKENMSELDKYEEELQELKNLLKIKRNKEKKKK